MYYFAPHLAPQQESLLFTLRGPREKLNNWIFFFKYVLDIPVSIFFNILQGVLKSSKTVLWPTLWCQKNTNFRIIFQATAFLLPWQPHSYCTIHHHDNMQNEICAS